MSTRPYCPTHEWHDDPDVDRTWEVYRCYAADGACLYVGMTDHTRTRLLWHARYSGSCEWFYYCARVETLPRQRCRWEAHALEIAEIQRLRPAFNRHHNPDPSPWTKPERRVLGWGQYPPIVAAVAAAA